MIQATGNLEAFAKAAQQASDASSQAENGSSSLDNVLGSLNLSSLAAAAGMTALVTALGKIASAAIGFGKSAIDSFSNFEQIENSLVNVTKSAEKGKALFEDLRKFSLDTTFGVDTLANAASQLLSTGTAADKLKTRLKQLGDVAGGDTNKFNDLVSIMAKIQNTGKASSMQLQQLALRGVPIYQMLNEMGVEGTATSDEIVEAFERMTEAGGQFYNNMLSINETIQGKEGFISDTWREFLTSFAEASGIADAYKSVLDVIYDALQGIVDWLQEINKNPVSQAIFRGTLVAVLGTIATTIMATVIPALVATISKLQIIASLKAAIAAMNPVTLAVGAGIALVAGAFVAIDAATKEWRESLYDFENINVFEEIAGQVNDLNSALGISAEEVQEYLGEDVSDIFKDRLSGVDEYIKREFQALSGDLTADWRTSDIDSLVKNARDQYGDTAGEDLLNYIDLYHDIEKSAAGYASVLKKESLELEKQLSLQEMIQKGEERKLEIAQNIHEEYMKTNEYKVADLQAQIKELENYITNGEKIFTGYVENPYTHEKYATHDTVKPEGQQLKEAQAVLAMKKSSLNSLLGGSTKGKDSYTSWMEVFKDVTGVDAKKYKGKTDNERSLTQGGLAVREYVELLDSAISKQNELRQALDSGWQPTAEDKLSQERDKLQTLYKTLEELWANNDKITNASEKFVPENNSILQLENEIAEQQEKVWEAEKAAQEEKYQNLLDSINAETELVLLTEKERKVREYINQGFNETQANALAAAEAEKEGKQQFVELNEELMKRYRVLGMTGIQLRTQELIQQGINAEDAKALALAEKELNIKERLAKARREGKAALAIEKGKIALENYQETGEWAKGGRSDYAQGAMTSGWMGAIQGTDVGNLVEGTQKGGIWAGIIDMLVGALIKVVKSFDNFDDVMNFATRLIGKLAPLLQFIFDVLEMILDLVAAILDFLRPIMEVIKLIGKLLKNTVGEWLKKLAEIAEGFVQKFMAWLGLEDEYNASKQEEIDRVKELNKQYQTLSQAIDEQNQYYLQQKQKVNAEAYDRLLGATPVNDLIITKNGMFSTSPDDYIMAMKHPETLGSGNVQMNVKIVNERGSDTDVNVSQGQDENEMIITISKKVASDYAKGVNGWDGAVAYREKRQNGRKVTA